MDEHMWEEDRYTPEGIPMTAPTDAGMKGAQDWRYEQEQYRECEKKEHTPILLNHAAK